MTVTPVAKHPMAWRKSLGVRLMRKPAVSAFRQVTTLPRQTQRKLNLTGVEYRAGRPIARVWRILPVDISRSGTTWRTPIRPAEVRRSITCVEVADVDGVQHVEGLS